LGTWIVECVDRDDAVRFGFVRHLGAFGAGDDHSHTHHATRPRPARRPTLDCLPAAPDDVVEAGFGHRENSIAPRAPAVQFSGVFASAPRRECSGSFGDLVIQRIEFQQG